MAARARSIDWGTVAALGIPLIVLVWTTQGGIAYWDTGEMQVVPWIFGIPHPTGFPAFVLFAGSFAHLLPFGAVSWRIAFFCTLLTFGSVAMLYFTIRKYGNSRLIAAACAWIAAFNPITWLYGTRAEVHTMEAFFSTVAICCFLLGYREGRADFFRWGSLAFGLALATHPLALFLVPALLIIFASSRRSLNARLVPACIGLALLPLILYAYLPIRSHIVVAQHLDPAQALGKPLGSDFWNTDNPQSWSGFVQLVTGREFHASASALHAVNLVSTASAAPRFVLMMARAFTFPGLALVLISLGLLVYRMPAIALALVTAIILPASFALTYAAIVQPERYFFVPIACVCLIAGLGAGALERRFHTLLLVPFGALAIFLVVSTYGTAGVWSRFNADPVITDVLDVTRPNSVVIASWTYGTPLAYAAYVQERMGRRRIDIAWPFQDAPYVRRWLASGPVYYVGQRVGGDVTVLCRLPAKTPIYRLMLPPARCK